MNLPLPWLDTSDALPNVDNAWADDSPAPGLLAAGADLSVTRLLEAYSHGIFPWFSQGQPVLWWAPNPRMVLDIHRFRLHRSLRKTLQRFRADPRCEIRVDHGFQRVITACATTSREGQNGTWIVPSMVDAYTALHGAGHAHCIETWMDGELVGGLYCVSIGKAVFGESMFARRTDASKIALAALVALCGAQGAGWIDCQQNTAHLASLGAQEIDRTTFVGKVALARNQAPLHWHFEPLYWDWLLSRPPQSA